MIRFLLALVLLIMSPAVAQAAVERYTFDKTHTQILFFVSHLGYSLSQGEFHKFDGLIEFDRENPENSKVHVTIYPGSADMDDKTWNKHMKNQDFFDIGEHPKATFKSTKITVTGENTADIEGRLKLKGITEPVTLKVVFNKAGVNPYTNKYTAGFSATAKIKRSDFNIRFGLPVVGNDVYLRFEVEGIREE